MGNVTSKVTQPRRLGRAAWQLGPVVVAACLAAPEPVVSEGRPTVDWPIYGGSALGDRYSTLAQINPATTARLAEAWRVELGPGDLQCSPLVVDGTLFGYTPTRQVIAVDASSGARKWLWDSGVPSRQPARGLAYWREGGERRLFVTGAYKYLYALDPETGAPIPGFGHGGRVDVTAALGGGDPPIALTSPPAVYRGLVIVGFRTTESEGAAAGAIQAFDARSGQLRWIFHTLPREGEFGAETWPKGGRHQQGGANAWAGLTVDPERGIVFAPTGSATPDFVGKGRAGDNLFASTLLALDAATGKRIWHFQVVRHDIFDRDLASPPTMVTVRRGGRPVDAVAQPTKHGFLFLFERATGRPLFPIRERAAPGSDVPGETTAPRQPAPKRPAPFARQYFTAEMLTRRTPEAYALASAAYRQLRSQGPFTPMTASGGTLVFPGFDGGAESLATTLTF
ncbi:MAG: PQQ-binding-like beta-propeller repeat protein [Phenylobacterium sp.]|uniref:outer membrane protein assembly factor BamB family protein n=1 Tax=Phenylobacterium sp. TaxID=1871053 RepID=UPI0035657E6A